ncbi:protein adenylyltransferase SelO [Magnetofaba australis]|uniref:Protein nucleotidyltransferase YdiU n=1 Tax=Magnetofaba australis IT-1 TaxID=1434232 RepID=A0A1Y2K3Z9_9PROT|nr:YdiU family protein [Magnetofaba australis]OSM04060.1 hypothetical protein MAIT1_03683 [Magnetofaba australis IT-1]
MKAVGWSLENSFGALPDLLFTPLAPTPVTRPTLVALNAPLAKDLGLDFSTLSEQEQAELFTGNRLPEGAQPLAQAYAGHQFGHFTMLGDGRAIVLGEQTTPSGARVDIQFKGSGRTPYSRNGDGRAALGPMLREYIISEAMAALGIPTTRSLAVAATGEWVYRETPEPGAILTRVAASHLRVGTFQYVAMRQDLSALAKLTQYALARHYPERLGDANPALSLLEAVIERQLALIVEWMRVGFIHGVMNTDNMAISGETIDYGPCAFMDAYHRETVFSSIDHAGRYAYGNQPTIAKWNLARLAEALLPLMDAEQNRAVALAEAAISDFVPRYNALWLRMMGDKFGLEGEEEGDAALIRELLDWMQDEGADFTRTFHGLRDGLPLDGELGQALSLTGWRQRWLARLQRNAGGLAAGQAVMARVNPVVIPRNHRVEEALEAASKEGDLGPMQALLAALAQPYAEGPELARYQESPKPDERVYQTFCGT